MSILRQRFFLFLFTFILTGSFALPVGSAFSPKKSLGRSSESQNPPRPSRTQRLTTPDQTPDGLNKGDWKNIRQAYEAGNRKIFESKPGQEWATRNRGQGWRAEFDGSGVRLATDSGETRLGLKLDGYGFSGNTTPVGPKSRRVTAADNRVEYIWDERLTEWFVNDEKGLEQGWTLASAPSGATTARLEIDVTGGLKVASVDAGAVALTEANGSTAMTYGGLKAWDATGRTLPAQLEAISGNRIRVTVETADAVCPVTIDPTVQQAYLKASNTDVADFFGNSVAVSGDTVVIGAFGEDSNSTGVNGNQADNSAPDSGAVYVFVRNGMTWSQQAYLKASNTNASDLFGDSVAILGDTIVVGASGEASNATGVNGNQTDNSATGAGAAYVFVRTGTMWSQQAYLKASNTDARDAFGLSVSVSGDTVVVGALNEDSNTTGVNGNQADNSATDAGAAYVFVRNGIAWVQQAYLKASNTGADDRFGVSVAISGDTTVVGAFTEDSNAIGVNGDGINNSALNAGAAYVFVRNGTTWSQQAYLKASNTEGGDQFGFSVAISSNTVVVSANNEDSNAIGVNGNQANNSAFDSGAVYVFVRVGTVWSQQAYLKASNTNSGDQFSRVAISGDTIVVGARGEASNATGVNGDQANNSASFSGAAYLFVRNGLVWSQQSYLKASNTGASDEFGRTVAISGDTVVVGATGEDSNATGVNGNQADNSANFAGAAYIFTFPVSCSYSLSANSINFPASGGNGSVTLTTTTGCAWNVSGIPGWISNVSPANGTGTTAITYSVNPNFSGTPRSATLTIGDQSYTVNQDGAVPVNALLSFSFTSQSVNPPTCSPTYSNDLVLTATVTNTSSQTIYSPSFRVLELQEASGTPPANPFRLLTADGATCGSGGLVGAIQSTDGQSPTPVTLPTLAPGQSVSVRFVIAMQSLRRIRFVIDANGSLVPPAGSASRPVTEKYNTTKNGMKRGVVGFAFLIEPSGLNFDVVPDPTRLNHRRDPEPRAER